VAPVTVILVVPRLYTLKVCGALIVPAPCGVKLMPVGNAAAEVAAQAGIAATSTELTAKKLRQSLAVNTRFRRHIVWSPSGGGEF